MKITFERYKTSTFIVIYSLYLYFLGLSRSLVENYGKHDVYTDGGTWYDEACNVLRLKHYLHLPFQKSLMERVNQYFKDRIESFDDYYPCMQKDECNLFHVYNLIQFFVSMYNNTTPENYFILLTN